MELPLGFLGKVQRVFKSFEEECKEDFVGVCGAQELKPCTCYYAAIGSGWFSGCASSREVRLNLSFVAKNYLYFFPERCDHKK